MNKRPARGRPGTREIGQKWTSARKAAGLSQTRAAALIGVDQTTITNIEQAYTYPRNDTTLRAALAYGCTVEALFPDDYSVVLQTPERIRSKVAAGRIAAQAGPPTQSGDLGA